jgi:RNA polymerase sigma-70 factor, ECF subfamily
MLEAVAREPDEELVARAMRGDRDAFAAIYHQLADAVYARLTRLLGPVSEREDVLQQVFIQLHRALPMYRGEATLATFVHRIAVNAAYDHLRARRRRPVLPASAPELDELVSDAPSPAVRTERREELSQLFDLLAMLAPDKRIALVLVGVEGLSLRETAELERLSGVKDVHPDAATAAQIAKAGKRVVAAVKMCVGADGRITSTKLLKSSGYPAYDHEILDAIAAWTYRARANEVCTAVTFIYSP